MSWIVSNFKMIVSLIAILNPSSCLIIVSEKSFADFGKRLSLLFGKLTIRLTPLITKVFGSTDFIGIEDSGINELFKPPRRGRPPRKDAKKRQRQDFDVEYHPTTTSSNRNLRRKGLRKRVPAEAPPLEASSSDTNKVLNIADILLQATDLRTGQVKVWNGMIAHSLMFMDTPEKSQ